MIKVVKTQNTENGMKKLASFEASFNDLVELLGRPNVVSGDDKTSNEWNVLVTDTELEEENICCIYDFKQGCYEPTETITWNIGSNDFCSAIELKVWITTRLVSLDIEGLEPSDIDF